MQTTKPSKTLPLGIRRALERVERKTMSRAKRGGWASPEDCELWVMERALEELRGLRRTASPA